jgi:hypothetical protein
MSGTQILSVFFLCLALQQCNSAARVKHAEQKGAKTYMVQEPAPEPPPTRLDTTFVYENDTMLQSLTISRLPGKEIRFILTSRHKSSNLASLLEGTAARVEDTDVGIDQDEQGAGYEVHEYRYSGSCALKIRVDAARYRKARIDDSGCEGKDPARPPFGSPGILHRLLYK